MRLIGEKSRVALGAAASLAFSCISFGVSAGPPFLTDDPEPTATGHWELYAPLVEGAGRGADFDGAAGVELNYGAAPNLQLTLGLPVAFVHDAGGWQWGAGDVELSAKYRLVHDEEAGLQVAVFPGISLPTASNGMGARNVTGFLPIWVQKDAGPWSIFGGGGYAINPGQGNRDYWSAGIAMTRSIGEQLLLGAEVDRQGADTVDGNGSTSLGLGVIYQLNQSFRLLGSAGPTFDDAGDDVGFHAFMALGWDF